VSIPLASRFAAAAALSLCVAALGCEPQKDGASTTKETPSGSDASPPAPSSVPVPDGGPPALRPSVDDAGAPTKVTPPPPPSTPPSSGFAAECAALGLSAASCSEWAQKTLPDALPAARGNSHGDDPNAATLGYELFFDLAALSPDDVRCAACHSPDRDFSNNVALPSGSGIALRNAPSLVNAARNYPHFWDGRADSLWSQSLFTIENPDEMRGTRVAVVQKVAASYRDVYEKAFGPMPDLTGLPAQGKPGSPEWATMNKDAQDMVTRVYTNVGKSFEAYLRKVAGGPSAFDRYIAGDRTAITDSAKQGLLVFTKSGCLTCHSGPNFSDGQYHALDVPLPSYPPYAAKSATDRGRAQGLTFVLASEFNSLSPYYDRAAGETPHMEEDVSPVPDGMFLTPSLRNVSQTAPYSHNGSFTALSDIVRFILDGGGPNCIELAPHSHSDDDVANVVEFLGSLRGDTAPLPWSTWPQIGASPVAYDGGTSATAK
jgi:cytochrome c peroxidase